MSTVSVSSTSAAPSQGPKQELSMEAIDAALRKLGISNVSAAKLVETAKQEDKPVSSSTPKPASAPPASAKPATVNLTNASPTDNLAIIPAYKSTFSKARKPLTAKEKERIKRMRALDKAAFNSKNLPEPYASVYLALYGGTQGDLPDFAGNTTSNTTSSTTISNTTVSNSPDPHKSGDKRTAPGEEEETSEKKRAKTEKTEEEKKKEKEENNKWLNHLPFIQATIKLTPAPEDEDQESDTPPEQVFTDVWCLWDTGAQFCQMSTSLLDPAITLGQESGRAHMNIKFTGIDGYKPDGESTGFTSTMAFRARMPNDTKFIILGQYALLNRLWFTIQPKTLILEMQEPDKKDDEKVYRHTYGYIDIRAYADPLDGRTVDL